MNCVRDSTSINSKSGSHFDGAATFLISERNFFSAKNSIKYNNKRCNCKCTTRVMQMQQLQQQLPPLQQKHSYQLNVSNDVETLLQCCRMQQRATGAPTAPAPPSERRATLTRKSPLETTVKIQSATPTTTTITAKTITQPKITAVASIDTIRRTATYNRATNCCCSVLEGERSQTKSNHTNNSNKPNVSFQREHFIAPNLLLAMDLPRKTCTNSSTTRSTSPVKMMHCLFLAAGGTHYRTSRRSTHSNRNCDVVSNGNSQSHHISKNQYVVNKVNLMKMSEAPSAASPPLSSSSSLFSSSSSSPKKCIVLPSPPPSTSPLLGGVSTTSQRNLKLNRVLPYYWLFSNALVVFTTILVILQRYRLIEVKQQQRQHQQQSRTRKCCTFLFFSLLWAQLLASTPATLAQRGSSSAGLGLEIAIGTTSSMPADLRRSKLTDTAASFHEEQRTLDDDTDLEATFQKLIDSNKNITNISGKRLRSAQDISMLDGRSLVELINRDKVLDRAHVTQAATATATATTEIPSYGGCLSCHMREKAKLENLESIKEHILMRLKLSKLPNITKTIQVPHEIIENFYKISSSKKKLRSTAIRSTDKGTSSQERHYGSSSTEAAPDVMQGDDPKAYPWQDLTHAESVAGVDEQEEGEYEEDFEEKFYSRVNSVYLFPTNSRIRHNRKHDILNFKFNQQHAATITHTIVHVYLRGYDWLREHEPALLQQYLRCGESDNERQREIVITVHRAVCRLNATNITHTIKLSETRHKVPSAQGKWVQIDVKQLPNLWMANRNATQGIIIRALEPWMQPLIVTSNGDSVQNKLLTVFIEVLTKDERKTRRKRSTSLDCSERDNEVRCCRYPLRVNFTNFGWNWVVAPTSFNAYFCNGECKLGFLEKHAHTHLASLSTSAQPCCSPTKMSALRLLYFNSDQILVLSTIPNMSVEKCSCS